MARVDNLKNFLTDIADKFREVLGTTGAIPHSWYDTMIDEVYGVGKSEGIIAGFQSGSKEGYEAGHTAGYNSGYDAGKMVFWDSYMPEKGTTTATFNRKFAGDGWTNTSWKPPYNMNVSSAQYTFWASPITDIQEYLDESGVELNFEPCSNFTQTFSYCKVKWLRKFGSSTKKGTYTSTFDNATNLHTIEEFYVVEDSTFSNTFNYCSALVNINVIGTISKNGVNLRWSTKLSKASMTSFKDALSTTTSGLTITWSKTAINNAFGIDVDDPTTYPEGSEFYEWRNSRENWTFNYA